MNLRVESPALANNPLGDPFVRDLPVIVPDGQDPRAQLPLVFVLSGYSGRGRMLLNDDPWSEPFDQRVARLTNASQIGPMIYALPDCFTRLGGSQYLDSSATGRYESYLWEDLLPLLKARFAVARIGVVGKSSGGYGAMVAAMRHPEIVSAVASHSGDMGFEYCYLPHFAQALRTLERYGGVTGFLSHFSASNSKKNSSLFEVIETLAMAACYGPDPKEPHGFSLPFHPLTGELRDEVWHRWLAWDPVRMLDEPHYADALRRMRLVFLDCGRRDEFSLDLGARLFAAKLRKLEVAHRHDEFDDGHMGISYRFDVSLPLLWEALRS